MQPCFLLVCLALSTSHHYHQEQRAIDQTGRMQPDEREAASVLQPLRQGEQLNKAGGQGRRFGTVTV